MCQTKVFAALNSRPSRLVNKVELILHHYDCNHEMNHFKNEIDPCFFFLHQPQYKNMVHKHNKLHPLIQWIPKAKTISNLFTLLKLMVTNKPVANIFGKSQPIKQIDFPSMM